MTVPPLRIRRPYDLGLAPGDSGLQDRRNGGGVNSTMSMLVRDQQTAPPPASVYGGSGIWTGSVLVTSATWTSGTHTLTTPGWWTVTARVTVTGSGMSGSLSLFIGDTGSSLYDFSDVEEVDSVDQVSVSGAWLVGPGVYSAGDGFVLAQWSPTAGTTTDMRTVWRGLRVRDS